MNIEDTKRNTDR